MKRIALLMILALFLGCSTQQVKPAAKPTAAVSEKKEEKLEIFRSDEFVDIDSNTVKFMARSKPGTTLTVYIGEDEKALNKGGAKEKYDNGGIKITTFNPGKKYYYKITSEFEGQKAESSINSFVKKDLSVPKNAEWARTAVFYEIFVRSFYDTNEDGIGDFKGITAKLDYLKELGVDAVWLMPMNPSPSYHGYDVTDYYKVNPQYGTMEDFETLLSEAHKRGIKITIDFVVNHTGIDNEWFKKAMKKEEPYKNYYIFSDKYTDTSELSPFGGKLWNQKDNIYYYSVFWEGMPDLNMSHPATRDAIKNAAKFWIDKGVDGFRLDATKHINDEDWEITHGFWKEFNSYVKSVNKDFFLVGEAWEEDPEVVAPFFADMDSSFDFGMKSVIRSLGNGEPYPVTKNISDTATAYKKVNDNYIDTIFIGNHDMNRIASDYNGDIAKLKLAAAILFTLPGTPYIYYGEEIGMKGEKPDEYIREPMEWYTSVSGIGMTRMRKWAFAPAYIKSGDGISVEEEIDKSDSLLNFYKRLIAIRKEYKELFTEIPKKVNTAKKIYGYEIENDKYKIRTIFNISKEKYDYIVGENENGKSIDLLGNVKGDVYVLEDGGIIILKIEK